VTTRGARGRRADDAAEAADVITPHSPGRVLVRGAPRRALDLFAVDRVWDADRAGWLVAEDAPNMIGVWARSSGSRAHGGGAA
jgi:hypothetical protein